MNEKFNGDIDEPLYKDCRPGAVTWLAGDATPAFRAALEKAQKVEGVKFDDDKPRYDLIPPEALEGLAKVLTFGAKKYAPRNWEKGMTWGRVFAALMRHLWAWWRGEDKDAETGLSHLDHAACCIAFLQTYEVRHSGTDDRGQK
jgi:hypothetical protein